ncbi:MAG: transglutaminase-like domain-containing protein [Chlorobi bacterium]|nr:transglutaminase-like domain-containing protein [Chlorobiota bacterium]
MHDCSELQALADLLDDTDPVVTTAVQRRLIAYQFAAVPMLRRILHESTPDSTTHANALACLRGIQTEALSQLVGDVMMAIAENTGVNLERAVLNLSAFAFPETNPEPCSRCLDELALAVARRARNQSAIQQLLALNTVLFEQEGFRGAIANFYAPQHTYIAPLLHTREGIPITLSVLYILVATRIGIELHGIGMPLHFLVYHPELDVFIDCFNAGTFISRAECRRFIEQAGFTFSDTMLERRSNIEIVQRMIRNAIYAHTKAGEQWEADTLTETLEIITHLTEQQ